MSIIRKTVRDSDRTVIEYNRQGAARAERAHLGRQIAPILETIQNLADRVEVWDQCEQIRALFEETPTTRMSDTPTREG